jgi:Acyltransferase
MDAEIRKLSDAIIGEIFLALGFSKNGWAFQTFGSLFYKAADRLSEIAVTADRMIETDGFPKAAAWMLTHWCNAVTSRGEETIPPSGPLLIISNHAGTYDTFVLASQIGRNDLKLIASDVPFLKYLPNAKDHIFFLSENTQDRMIAARSGIHHLKQGGALLLYGTGLIDPDPSVYPDADQWIDKWLPSIDLFLRTVPEIRVVLSIVSGVVSKKWAYHPITWLKRIDWQKRRLAEFGQVLQQLFRPGSLYLTPSISFAPPVDIETLRRESNSDKLLPAVIARGKNLLVGHCNIYN